MLEQEINGKWTKLWKIVGVKDSSECTDSKYPYFTNVAGVLANKNKINLSVVIPKFNGKTFGPIAFAVVVK